MQLNYADSLTPDSVYATVLSFEDLNGKLIYKSESPEIKIRFNGIDPDFQIIIDEDTTLLYTKSAVVVTDLKRGDHTIVLFRSNGKVIENISSSFKIKAHPPFIKNDAVVFGLLMFVLFLIFKSTQMKAFKGFYSYNNRYKAY